MSSKCNIVNTKLAITIKSIIYDAKLIRLHIALSALCTISILKSDNRTVPD